MQPQTPTPTPSPTPPRITSTGCCPPFDPAPWDDKEIRWDDKLFVKEHVRALFHVPLRMGTTVTRAMDTIARAGATAAKPLMLAHDTSPWGSDLFIDVTKEVPGAEMAKISGTFLTKVFEGPFRDAGTWVRIMERIVTARGHRMQRLYLGYTTCPGCAKAYGKNYVILLAQIAD
jgi:hypothetical protein